MKKVVLTFLILILLLLVSCGNNGKNIIGNAYQTLSSPERMEYEECFADRCQDLMKIDQSPCAEKCYNQAKSS